MESIRSDARILRSPHSALTKARGFVLVAITVNALACIASGYVYFFSTAIPWLCAGIALILAIIAVVRNRRYLTSSAQRLNWNRCGTWLLIVLLLFALQSAACVHMNHRFILLDWSFVSGVNLRGIHQATLVYQKDRDELPDSLLRLLNADLIADLQMVAPGDVGGRVSLRSTTIAAFTPSYTFQPVAQNHNLDPSAILAYERKPWSVKEFKLRPTHVHAVIFGDGRVEFLTSQELDAALKRKP